MTPYQKGLLLTAIGVVVLSPDSALLRMVDAPLLTIVFWRGIGFFAMLMAITLWLRPRHIIADMRDFGWLGVVLVINFSLSQMAFVFAIMLTNPANVLVILSAAPFFGAIFSRFLLNEHLEKPTIIAILFAMIGVAITGLLEVETGNWLGNMIALFIPMGLGLSFTVIRKAKVAFPLPTFAMSGILTGAVLLPFVGFSGLYVAMPDAVILAGVVVVLVPIAFTIVAVFGPKNMPAADVGLLMLLETVLGPIWVWWWLGIPPTINSIIGGSILITTLLCYYIPKIR